MAEITRLKSIYLYDDPDSEGLNVIDLAAYLVARLPGCDVTPRSHFITHAIARFAREQQDILVDELSRQLRGFEIDNLVIPEDRGKVPDEPAEDLELGTIYDATGLMAAFRLLIADEESGAEHLHIIFTDHCIADWDTSLRRLRLRVAALGQPTIISTTGLVEAPEMPKQYHFMRTQLAVFGVEDEIEDLADQFADRTLGYGDPRLNEVLKGYVLKAAFYRMFNEATCRTRGCRLFDAQSHEQVLATQVGGRPGLCDRHAKMLQKVGGDPE